MTLHIFNPETDYALASDRRYYTLPAHVKEVRGKLALTPALYAKPKDVILLLDGEMTTAATLTHHEEVKKKDIRVIDTNYLLAHRGEFEGIKVRPWGWNRSIRQFVMETIENPAGLPTDEDLTNLRELQHRRTTIAMHQTMSADMADEIEAPKEIMTVEEAMTHYLSDKRRYFKAPWSSSGRGILLTDDLEPRHVEPWLRGVISRQGSVMTEKAYDRILDFATEWLIEEGEARFLGYSVFHTSRRGKYHSNENASQRELLEIIREKAAGWNEESLRQLKTGIESVVGCRYEGPLGIDMLVTTLGNVNPCVEMNFRMTMGIAMLQE